MFRLFATLCLAAVATNGLSVQTMRGAHSNPLGRLQPEEVKPPTPCEPTKAPRDLHNAELKDSDGDVQSAIDASEPAAELVDNGDDDTYEALSTDEEVDSDDAVAEPVPTADSYEPEDDEVATHEDIAEPVPTADGYEDVTAGDDDYEETTGDDNVSAVGSTTTEARLDAVEGKIDDLQASLDDLIADHHPVEPADTDEEPVEPVESEPESETEPEPEPAAVADAQSIVDKIEQTKENIKNELQGSNDDVESADEPAEESPEAAEATAAPAEVDEPAVEVTAAPAVEEPAAEPVAGTEAPTQEVALHAVQDPTETIDTTPDTPAEQAAADNAAE